MLAAGVRNSIDKMRPVTPLPAPGALMSAPAAPAEGSVPIARELERIYVEFAPLVYRTAWGVLGSREDADDVVQTVFMALLHRDLLV